MYFNFFSSILCTFLRKRVVSNWSQFINSNSFTLVYPDLLGWSISWQLVTWQNKRNLATKKDFSAASNIDMSVLAVQHLQPHQIVNRGYQIFNHDYRLIRIGSIGMIPYVSITHLWNGLLFSIFIWQQNHADGGHRPMPTHS